jgi:hypothetical protein
MTTLLKYLELIDQDFPVGFEQLEVIYEDSWSDWEEYGAVVVFDFEGELFKIEHGYSVMAEDNSFVFDPEPITPEQLEALKKEWESK